MGNLAKTDAHVIDALLKSETGVYKTDFLPEQRSQKFLSIFIIYFIAIFIATSKLVITGICGISERTFNAEKDS